MTDQPESKYEAAARIRAAVLAGTLDRSQAVADLVEVYAGGLTAVGAADVLDRREPYSSATWPDDPEPDPDWNP
jgi:hypothetical protein